MRRVRARATYQTLGIDREDGDPTHVFALSQIYEGLLLKMGEKGSDAGQFFTPREVIRAMVRAIAPKLGEDDTLRLHQLHRSHNSKHRGS